MSNKPPSDSFSDWYSTAFGFGYGTGDVHIVPALKMFFAACQMPHGSYSHEDLEEKLTPTVAWMMINVMGQQDVIEYGTSPRWGWLTLHGMELKKFVDQQTADTLLALACRDENYNVCYPDACNCGPTGYRAGMVCDNPFWKKRK